MNFYKLATPCACSFPYVFHTIFSTCLTNMWKFKIRFFLYLTGLKWLSRDKSGIFFVSISEGLILENLMLSVKTVFMMCISFFKYCDSFKLSNVWTKWKCCRPLAMNRMQTYCRIGPDLHKYFQILLWGLNFYGTICVWYAEYVIYKF